MRLIDADALMDELLEKLPKGAVFYRIPPNAIENAPTVDAVPVVRCKDCIYSVKRLHEIENYRLCRLGDHPTRDDYYCNFGVKKKEDRINGETIHQN